MPVHTGANFIIALLAVIKIDIGKTIIQRSSMVDGDKSKFKSNQIYEKN
jgi:hypothetical protein